MSYAQSRTRPQNRRDFVTNIGVKLRAFLFIEQCLTMLKSSDIENSVRTTILHYHLNSVGCGRLRKRAISKFYAIYFMKIKNFECCQDC